MNFQVMQPIYSYMSQYYEPHVAVGWTLMLAGATCAMSLLCALVLGELPDFVFSSLERHIGGAGVDSSND